MKNYLLYLLLFLCFIVQGQVREPIYLLFNQNESANCQFVISKEPVKKMNLNYTQKRHRKVNITRFILCRNIFVFELKNNHFEIVDAATFSKYKITTINELLSSEEAAEFKLDINQLFPKIFLLEAYEDGQYAKYEVVWEKTL